MIDSAAVISGYRLLLDREPESAAAIAEKCAECVSVEALVANLVCSNEFMNRNRDWLLAHF